MSPSRLAALLLGVLLFGCTLAGPTRVLVFSKTAGYRHESIGPDKLALAALGKAWFARNPDAGLSRLEFPAR
jgi:hypothetical protein